MPRAIFVCYNLIYSNQLKLMIVMLRKRMCLQEGGILLGWLDIHGTRSTLDISHRFCAEVSKAATQIHEVANLLTIKYKILPQNKRWIACWVFIVPYYIDLIFNELCKDLVFYHQSMRTACECSLGSHCSKNSFGYFHFVVMASVYDLILSPKCRRDHRTTICDSREYVALLVYSTSALFSASSNGKCPG